MLNGIHGVNVYIFGVSAQVHKKMTENLIAPKASAEGACILGNGLLLIVYDWLP